MSINIEATIRWKGYNPNDLSKSSAKRVWTNCECCDGDYWHNYPDGTEKDKKQDKILKENGWKVIRFWEHEINSTIEECLYKFELEYNGVI